ncbi:MAG: hypothetical protein U0401_24220 [Anaerolineae bacterium]
MTVTEILQSARFIVNQEGKPIAAVVDMQAWEVFCSILEKMEDTELVKERMKNWQTKEGWTRWEDFEVELEADALSPVD